MNIHELIDKKKNEILEELEKKFIQQYHWTLEDAKKQIEDFVKQLKACIEEKPITAEDLLRIIEKDGVVIRDVVDIRKDLGWSIRSLRDIVSFVVEKRAYNKEYSGKVRVTVIVEPIE